MNAVLAMIFLASTGAAAIEGANPDASLSAPAAVVQTTWNDVHLYIAAHAAQTDETTEALLRAEAEEGVATWVTFTAMGGGGKRASLQPLNGPGLGWPAAGRVILFHTEAETATAAALILEFASGGKR